MMKKITKGKVRSVKDIKVIVRFRGQSEAVFYTDSSGEKLYSESTLYGNVFPVSGALYGGEDDFGEDFFRQALRKRNTTAKIVRMSNYCSSMRAMITENLNERSADGSLTGSGGLYTGLVPAESEPLPIEEMYQKKAETDTGEDEVYEVYDEDGRAFGDLDTDDDEGGDGYVEVSTTGKLTEYERHYMISYSEYFQPFNENEIYVGFDGKREVSVLIFKNNPDVIMISYNEFNDEFMTFVKNKTTVDFYSDDFNDPYIDFDDEFYEERDFGIDYLTINTGNVTSTINSDNGDLTLNYSVGLFSGTLGAAEYSLKYQVL